MGVNFALTPPADPLGHAEVLSDIYGEVKRFKTFTYDRAYLSALKAVGATHVIVGVPNEELADVAGGVGAATAIVEAIRPFAAAMALTVAVGTQPLAFWHEPLDVYAPYLVDAVRNMRTAIQTAGLTGTIKVTVPHIYDVLETSYPPTDGAFQPKYAQIIRDICQMIRDDGGFFTINIYPWFTYRGIPGAVTLDYALLKEAHTVGGITYANMMLAQMAAVRAALLRLDSTFTESNLPIVVGETGWPTTGHVDATEANAATFISNVVQMAADGLIDVYLFEAFDEPGKQAIPGTLQDKVEEKNFGLVHKLPKYPIIGLGGAGAQVLSVSTPTSGAKCMHPGATAVLWGSRRVLSCGAVVGRCAVGQL